MERIAQLDQEVAELKSQNSRLSQVGTQALRHSGNQAFRNSVSQALRQSFNHAFRHLKLSYSGT